MEIKQNFKNLNSCVHLQSMSVFFPKFVSSSVEQGCYKGCPGETDVKVT